MDGSEFIGPFTLYDQLDPFYNVNIADGDVNIAYSDTIIVSFNEPVRLSGGQPLTDDSAKENFIIINLKVIIQVDYLVFIKLIQIVRTI